MLFAHWLITGVDGCLPVPYVIHIRYLQYVEP